MKIREFLFNEPKIGDYILHESNIGRIIDIEYVKSIFPLAISKNYHVESGDRRYRINEHKVKRWSSKKEKLLI